MVGIRRRNVARILAGRCRAVGHRYCGAGHRRPTSRRSCRLRRRGIRRARPRPSPGHHARQPCRRLRRAGARAGRGFHGPGHRRPRRGGPNFDCVRADSHGQPVRHARGADLDSTCARRRAGSIDQFIQSPAFVAWGICLRRDIYRDWTAGDSRSVIDGSRCGFALSVGAAEHRRSDRRCPWRTSAYDGNRWMGLSIDRTLTRPSTHSARFAWLAYCCRPQMQTNAKKALADSSP